MSWTNVAKPDASTYTNVNPQGKEQYDQPSIMYDDPNVFYDGIDPNQWTGINKPIYTYGNTVLTNGNFNGNANGWNLNTGWAYGSNNIVHTPGNDDEADQQSITLVVGQPYSIQLTISGTAGSIRIEMAGVSQDYNAGVGVVSFVGIAQEEDSSFNLEPSSDFNGTISDITSLPIENWIKVSKPT